MRVYISVDMEGVAGVVHEDQTDPTEPRHAGEYNRMRRLMTSEANEYVDDDYREVFRTWRALHNLAGSS
jgi:D-amino peptidase